MMLSDSELREVNSLVREVARKHKSVEDPDFLRQACVYSHELPRRVRQFLTDFRLTEPEAGACVISGYQVDQEKIGVTPPHWKWRADAATSLEEQILLLLYGCLLGDPFGWLTQQDGHVVHDVFPIREHQYEQLSTGSEQVIWWHTEDAFHPYRPDYIGFLCLRNPDQIATTIAPADVTRLEAEQVRVLFEPRFHIRPDESHQGKNASDLRPPTQPTGREELLRRAYEKIDRMRLNPEKLSVFFGSPEAPYLRLDPYFMDPPIGDEEAQRAFEALVRVIDDGLMEFVLQPGDFCFIDNYRVVHGRKSFKPRYDGTDRWIKRISITRDLRKSRAARASSISRIIM